MPYKTEEEQKQYFKEYHQKNKKKRADQGRQRRYGISGEAFDILFSSQGECCAICKTTYPKGAGWCVDHDHRFRKPGMFIRGILCNHCNSTLGHAKDDPDVLRRAAQYLEVQFVS